jgi:hypothetical protein
MLAAGDTNMVQPFYVLYSTEGIQLSGVTATYSIFVDTDVDVWTNWNKLTWVYNKTGDSVYGAYYINETKVAEATGTGNLMRWDDDSYLIFGGYALSATSTLVKDRFLGIS